MNGGYRVYGYRWVVLAVFMFLQLMLQMLAISYTPITSKAVGYYGVGKELYVGLFFMVFMLAFIPLSLPVSWLIDLRGFRFMANIAAVLIAVFGIARGLVGDDYTAALLCTMGIAVAQPVMMNSWTKVPARWFAPTQRATGVGLITLASVSGVALGMLLTPLLAGSMSIARVQLLYGCVAAVAAVLFLALAREHPPTPPGPPQVREHASPLAGLRHAFSIRTFWAAIVISFIGYSAFHGVVTWVELIIKPRGFSATQAGITGSVMLFAGIAGTFVWSALSDRYRKRVQFMVIALAGGVPGVLGIAFVKSAGLLYLFAAILGFFVVVVLPLVLQYAAEMTRPTPEGTTAGVIQLAGQLSVVVVYLMDALKTSDGSFWISLLLVASLLAACAVMTSRLKDPVIVSGPGPEAEAAAADVTEAAAADMA